LARLGEVEVYTKASEFGEEVAVEGDAALAALIDPANWQDPVEHPDARLVYALATDLGERRYFGSTDTQ
jgi:hypothetical protein